MIKPQKWQLLFPMLGNDGCSKLCIGTASPSQWVSLAQKSICWTAALSAPQKSPVLPLRDCVSPSSFCVTLSGAALSLPLLLWLSGMYPRPWTQVPLLNCPSHCNSDHLAQLSQQTTPRKTELYDLLVCAQLTLKPPLILFMLMNQQSRLSR